MICFFINDIKSLTVKYVSNISDEIIEISKTDFQRLDKFEIFKGYEDIADDDKKLISFKNDFEKWRYEIKNLYSEENYNFLDVYKYSRISFLVEYFFLKY